MSPDPPVSPTATLWAISDLHVGYEDNKDIVRGLTSTHDDDWLIVAGDVGETPAQLDWTLRELTARFATVIWVPGNHELWTTKDDPVQLRGQQRYLHLVELCRGLGVLTPEDPYPVWLGPGGPVSIAPLFLLYDYTFRPEGATTKEEALAVAYASGVVCTDEHFLHPDPYDSRDDWCRARVEATERRLTELGGVPTVLVNHWPIVREPTRILRYPEFAQWCGTELTESWPTRFNAEAVVYGHLHIPRSGRYDGVRHEEVSVGYPREWRNQRFRPPGWLRRILPVEQP